MCVRRCVQSLQLAVGYANTSQPLLTTPLILWRLHSNISFRMYANILKTSRFATNYNSPFCENEQNALCAFVYRQPKLRSNFLEIKKPPRCGGGYISAIQFAILLGLVVPFAVLLLLQCQARYLPILLEY